MAQSDFVLTIINTPRWTGLMPILVASGNRIGAMIADRRRIHHIAAASTVR